MPTALTVSTRPANTRKCRVSAPPPRTKQTQASRHVCNARPHNWDWTRVTPDIQTAGSSVIACMGNVGPGFSAVGPLMNYASIPDAGNAILTALMLVGRLELYTVLAIFMPAFWRK